MKKHLIASITALLISTTNLAWSTQATAHLNQSNHKANAMTTVKLNAGINNINFKSQGVNLAAHLYLPQGFDSKGSYPAVIFSPPFNQVKEQTGAVYAQ